MGRLRDEEAGPVRGQSISVMARQSCTVEYSMKSWHHLLWATVALGALFVAWTAVGAWKAQITNTVTQDANNKALRPQLAEVQAERKAADTPHKQSQFVGRTLAPIWQKHATMQAGQITAKSDGAVPAAPSTGKGGDWNPALPDAPSAIPPDMRQFEMPTQPGELFGSDFYIPKSYMSDFADHESQCKQDSLSLQTCKVNLATANKAAKGGGFFSRLKANAKWFVVGSAAGAAALCGTGHCR